MPRVAGYGKVGYLLICDHCKAKIKEEKVLGIAVTSKAAIAFFTHEEPARYFCDKKCMKEWVLESIK